MFINIIKAMKTTPVQVRAGGGAVLALVSAVVLSSSAGSVRAQEHGHWGDDHGQWHGDYPRFHEFDLNHWRSAHWWHGLHEGRDGWWWVLDGAWYWYPAPIYPYPDPYRPPVVVAPAAPAPGPLWYYCRNPQGYYPYVATCMVPWEPVTPR